MEVTRKEQKRLFFSGPYPSSLLISPLYLPMQNRLKI